ncbi:hypothetical protein [Cryptosporangium minutisporangium]|uniref:Uncharacterized protein n=2 Tax=Cryptosporangium minutisporangium TaxID=113569 RepID=A0ABP6SUZ6_9ACTN
MRYLVRVHGHLSRDLVSAFPQMVPAEGPAETVLRGELPDQSALMGILHHLDEMGVAIAAVIELPDGEE